MFSALHARFAIIHNEFNLASIGIFSVLAMTLVLALVLALVLVLELTLL